MSFNDEPDLYHSDEEVVDDVTRLRMELELQLPGYATATAMTDSSLICSLHHSSWLRLILNPLSEAGDQTCVFMDASQICFR